MAAAIVVVASGAQAADPIFDKAMPREPVYRCDITGFIELPGTDTCFKVGGFARFGMTAGSTNWFGPSWRVGNIRPWTATQQDRPLMFSEGRVSFDARTRTEYGTLRGFIEMQAADDKTRSGGGFALRHAFVQLGNWTFGKTWSTFLHRASDAESPAGHDRLGNNSMRRNQVRYSQPVGGGISFSVAVEDQAYNYGTAAAAPVAAPFIDSTGKVISVVGTEAALLGPAYKDRGVIPDIVAAVTASGDWGSAQISGAAHDNRVRNGGGLLTPAFTDRQWGWAGLFGLSLNLPTGDKDTLGFKAVYTDGASQYHQDLYPGNVNVTWGRPFGVIGASDQILSTVRTWSLLGYVQHFWTPTVSTSLGAAYAEIDFRRAGTAAAPGTVTNPAGTGAKRLYELFATVEWTPVPRFSVLFDVAYGHADWRDQVLPGLPGDLSKSKGGAVVGTVQVTRSF